MQSAKQKCTLWNRATVLIGFVFKKIQVAIYLILVPSINCEKYIKSLLKKRGKNEGKNEMKSFTYYRFLSFTDIF